jgi:hypothetical protein
MAGPTSRNHPALALSQKKGDGTRLADLVFPTGDGKLGMGMLFKFVEFEQSFSRASSGSVSSKNITQAHVALPLPENLQETLNLQYDTVDLGAVMAGIKSGEAVSDALSKGGPGSALSTFAGRLPGDAEFLARTLAQISGGVGGALNIAAGNVPNPFTTTVFKNVELRRHNFNFRLVPETPEDSQVIQNIINTFKKQSLPTKQGNFLKMPKEVEIEFFGTNALFGFGRCVLQGVTVNYAPSNQPAFFKNTGAGLIGAPQAVELQLQLSEIEQLLGDSFDAYGGNSDLGGRTSPIGAESQARGERQGNQLRDNITNPVNKYGR